jgi:TonB family protein
MGGRGRPDKAIRNNVFRRHCFNRARYLRYIQPASFPPSLFLRNLKGASSMRSRRTLSFASVLITLLAATVSMRSQTGIEWQVLQPAGEEFSITMPKDPVFESGKMPYHKMELNTRIYLSTIPDGPVLAVVSLSGIKSNPAAYSDLERLNSYVDAFKKLFVSKITTKPTQVRMTFAGNKNLNGHEGRKYQMSVGDRAGVAHVFGTRKRFYAIVFLNSKEADSLRDQFLSSFVLPEYVPPPPPPTVATQNLKPEPNPANEEKTAKAGENPENPAGAGNQEGTAAPKPEQGEPENKIADPQDPNAANPSHPDKRKPVSGGVLNNKALILPKPEYPPEARAARISGSVTVQVTIDEYGTVIVASAVSGHPLLQPPALRAAFGARFAPTTLVGEPVKVVGVIVYNFVAP